MQAERRRNEAAGTDRAGLWLLVLACLCLIGVPPAFALPGGEEVVSGEAEFQRSGAQLDIHQGTNKAIINYADFSIGAAEGVTFVQPGARSIALNRVPNGPVSNIAGRLTANGRIMLINPSGIVFADSARVSVHGLIASALNISDEDFLLDNYVFGGGVAGVSVANNGEITTAAGGEVFLVAPEVLNGGRIDAPEGEVGLVAGSAAYLTDDPFGDLVFEVPGRDRKVTNTGSIVSAGGNIDLYGAVVNQNGLASADAIETNGGTVRLVASDTARLGSGSSTTARSEEARGGSIGVNSNSVTVSGRAGASGREAGGSIQVRAATLYHEGTLHADGQDGPGGEVCLSAGSNLTANSTASISATGTEGGAIHLETGGLLVSSGSYQALGRDTAGGRIDIGGPGKVSVLCGALDASGAAGGGKIRVGGGYRGASDEVPLASHTIVSPGTELRADVTGAHGAGGQIIVWSQSGTQFYVHASAMPGTETVAGGLVELSSADELTFEGRDGIRTSRGERIGQILLDPVNITVSNAPTGVALAQQAVDGSPISKRLSLCAEGSFGSSTALNGSGDILVVGACCDNAGGTDRGAAYVFVLDPDDLAAPPLLEKRIGDGALLADASALSLNDGDLFGTSAALNDVGDILAIGTRRDDTGGTDRGAVYLLNLRTQQLSADPTLSSKIADGTALARGGTLALTDHDEFGSGVDLNAVGDVLAVGAHFDDTGGRNRGAVYLFGLETSDLGGDPKLEKKLAHSTVLSGGGTLSLGNDDEFGWATALNGPGDILAIGATRDDTGGLNRGAAYVLRLDPENLPGDPTLEKKITDGTPLIGGGSLSLGNGDFFGSSAALNGTGEILAVGASGDDTGAGQAGAVYLFDLDPTDLSADPTLGQKFAHGTTLTDGYSLSLEGFDFFGTSAALNSAGSILAVGADGDATGGSDCGAAYLFGLDTTDMSAPQTLEKKVAHGTPVLRPKTFSLNDRDYFGSSTALNSAGDILAVGAPAEGGAGPGRGVIYLFGLDTANPPGRPTLEKKIAHGTPLAGGGTFTLTSYNDFSASAALNDAGDILAVGAPVDSTAGAWHGAAYLFELDPSNLSGDPGLAKKIINGTALGGGGTLLLNDDDHFGRSVALNGAGDIFAVGAEGDDTGGTYYGATYLFGLDPADLSADPTLEKKLAHGMGLSGGGTLSLRKRDYFGHSTALNSAGDILVVGADGDSTGGDNRGAIYLFELDTADLSADPTLAKKVADGTALAGGGTLSLGNHDGFGNASTLNGTGDTLVVGAPFDNTGGADKGAIYLFGLDTANLSGDPTLGKKIADGSILAGGSTLTLSDFPYFGTSVALNGTGELLAVGSSLDNTGGSWRGTAYLFELDPSDLSADPALRKRLRHGTPLAGQAALSLRDSDFFGTSSALDDAGGILAVGAYGEDGTGVASGGVYLFGLSPSDLSAPLSLEKKIAHGTPLSGEMTLSLGTSDYFGYSVALSGGGETLAVGARLDDTGGTSRGAAYLFELDPSRLYADPAMAKKIAHGTPLSGSGSFAVADGDYFGSSATLNASGDILVVGAHGDDTGGINRGAAYLFGLNPSDLSADPTLEKKIAHGTSLSGGGTLSLADSDLFGLSAALNGTGDILAVGAPGDMQRGAAYLFGLDPANLSGDPTLAKKIAHGTDLSGGRALSLSSGDGFGSAAALNSTGDILAMGADSDDTGGTNRGAAYLFGLDTDNLSDRPVLAQKIAHGTALSSGGTLSLSGGERFGCSAALNSFGDILAVGAYSHDGGGTGRGTVYLFDVESGMAPSDLVTLLEDSDVTLQADNDIRVVSAIDATSNDPTVEGTLCLNAGRSVFLDADVLLVGPFSAVANDPTALSENRKPGDAVFSMAPGTHLSATRIECEIPGNSTGWIEVQSVSAAEDAQFRNYCDGAITISGDASAQGDIKLEGDPSLNCSVEVPGRIEGGGNVTMDVGGAIDIPGHVESIGGHIYLSGSEIGHGGALTVNSIVCTGQGSIELVSTRGDVIAAAISGEGRVSVDSAGAVLPASEGAEVPDIRAPEVELRAVLGIGGSESPLRTEAGRLAADSQAGGIFIWNYADGLEIGQVGNTAGLSLGEPGEIDPSIGLAYSGPLTINEPVINLAGGAVVFGTGEPILEPPNGSFEEVPLPEPAFSPGLPPGEPGAISVNAPVTATGEGGICFEPGGDFLMNADVITESGDIGIFSPPDPENPFVTTIGALLTTRGEAILVLGNEIVVEPAGMVHNQGAGFTRLMAMNDATVHGEVRGDSGLVEVGAWGQTRITGVVQVLGSDARLLGGTVLIEDGALVSNPSNGGLDIVAEEGDATVTGIEGGGRATVQAAGSILDGGESAPDIVAPDIELIAGTGIGRETNPIEIDADRMAATTTTGGIWLDDIAEGVQVTDVGETSGLSVTNGTQDDIHLRTFSPLRISADVSNTGGGRILLGAQGNSPGDDLTVDTGVNIQTDGGGAIELAAGSDVIQGGNVQAGGGGDVSLTANDRVALGGSITTDSGDVTIVAVEFDQQPGATIDAAGGRVTVTPPGGQQNQLAALLGELGSAESQGSQTGPSDVDGDEDEEEEEEEGEEGDEEEVADGRFPLPPSLLRTPSGPEAG